MESSNDSALIGGPAAAAATSTLATPTVSVRPVVTNQPEVPKLLLRRDSLSGNGNGWTSATKNKIASQQNEPNSNCQGSGNLIAPPKVSVRSSVLPTFSATRTVTENAVSMYNVIKASFKPAINLPAQTNYSKQVKNVPVQTTPDLQTTGVAIAENQQVVSRSSSASRGRGLEQKKGSKVEALIFGRNQI